MNLKNIIALFTVMLIFAGISSSAHSDLLIDNVFLISIGTEDVTRSSPGNPYYIDSRIELRSYEISANGVGRINSGPAFTETRVDNHRDSANAFAYFNFIPTGSLMRYINQAEGYVTDVDELYFDSGLPRALYDDEERYFEYENPIGYHNVEYGFETSCDFGVDRGLPYYTCSVRDEKDYSISFHLILTHLEGEGDLLYPEVIVTNKLWPVDEFDDNGDDSNGNGDDDNENGDSDNGDNGSDNDDNNDENGSNDNDNDDDSDNGDNGSSDNDTKIDEYEAYDVNFRRMKTDEFVYRAGELMVFDLSLENNGRDLIDAKAHIFLYGISNNEYRRYTIGPFNLINNDEISTKRHIMLPNDIEAGVYHVRVSVSDGSYRMVKHRDFIIE